MTDVNWGSRDALSIVRALNGGAGPQPPSAAATAWKSMQQALLDADTEFKTALGNAQAGWEGEAADAAIERMSPFGKWAMVAGKQSDSLSSGAEDYGSAFTGTRNTVPSEMEVMTARNNQLFSRAIAQAGPPNPATLANAEIADAVVAEQNAQAQAAMASYDAAVVSATKPVEFPPAPQMTAGTGTTDAGPGGGSVTYGGLGGDAVTGYSARTDPSTYRGSVAIGDPTSSMTPTAQQPTGGAQTGTVGTGTTGGSGTGTAGYSPIAGGAGVSGGAGTSAAGTTRGGGTSATPIVGGAATGAGAGGTGSRRSGAGAAGALGAGAAGGFAGGVGSGGSGSGGGRGGAGGYGGSGGSSGESAGRSGVGGRPGVGGSGPLNGAGASEGVAGRGGVTGGGRGAGGPMGAGAGRGQGHDDDEHQTPDYLKDFEHFEDGRVVAPPVIGADPQY